DGRTPEGCEVVCAHSQILHRASWIRAAPDTTDARLKAGPIRRPDRPAAAAKKLENRHLVSRGPIKIFELPAPHDVFALHELCTVMDGLHRENAPWRTLKSTPSAHCWARSRGRSAGWSGGNASTRPGARWRTPVGSSGRLSVGARALRPKTLILRGF